MWNSLLFLFVCIETKTGNCETSSKHFASGRGATFEFYGMGREGNGIRRRIAELHHRSARPLRGLEECLRPLRGLEECGDAFRRDRSARSADFL